MNVAPQPEIVGVFRFCVLAIKKKREKNNVDILGRSCMGWFNRVALVMFPPAASVSWEIYLYIYIVYSSLS